MTELAQYLPAYIQALGVTLWLSCVPRSAACCWGLP
jgi:hypothetical protein